ARRLAEEAALEARRLAEEAALEARRLADEAEARRGGFRLGPKMKPPLAPDRVPAAIRSLDKEVIPVSDTESVDSSPRIVSAKRKPQQFVFGSNSPLFVVAETVATADVKTSSNETSLNEFVGALADGDDEESPLTPDAGRRRLPKAKPLSHSFSSSTPTLAIASESRRYISDDSLRSPASASTDINSDLLGNDSQCVDVASCRVVDHRGPKAKPQGHGLSSSTYAASVTLEHHHVPVISGRGNGGS
ncbi:Hypothetical protein, putative, partial [Bodo saltans]